jgi:hypothetical protein
MKKNLNEEKAVNDKQKTIYAMSIRSLPSLLNTLKYFLIVLEKIFHE